MLESYKKQRKENSDKLAAEQAQENPVSQPKEKTLVEMLSDKKESVMLGGFLQNQGYTDVAERMMTGDLQEGDMDILEQVRAENVLKIYQAESLEKTITVDYVKELALQSPEFQKVVNLVGPEKAVRAFQNQLRDVAIQDPARFESMYTTLEKLTSFKSGDMKNLEKDIREQCSKIKLSENIFAATMALEDAEEREKTLRKNVRDSYNIFKRAGDFLTRGKWSKPDAEELAKNKPEMDRIISELNQHIADMGKTLGSVANENEVIRKAFANEIIGEKIKPKVETDSGFSEVRNEMKNEQSIISNAWSQFRAQSNFESVSPAEQGVIRDQFKNELKQKEKTKATKKGLWSRLWSSLFEKKIDNAELN